MPLACVLSCAVVGLEGEIVECEVDVSRRGLNSLALVGLPDTAVKEAKDRVESAIKNSGFLFPNGRIIINLAPADLRKEGPTYDLPIAVGIMVAGGRVHRRRSRLCVPRRALARWDRAPHAGRAADGRSGARPRHPDCVRACWPTPQKQPSSPT